MYPSPHDPHGYSNDSHPASGIPSLNQLQPCTPTAPYISSPAQPPVSPGRPWSTGLCHCFDDPAICAITCFCPCITYGQIAEIVNKGEPSCAASGLVYGLLAITGFACMYSCFSRSKMRAQYDLQEAPSVDCLVHFCCEPCALCQEYRELKNYGFDMGIGWQANMERQKRGITVAPVVSPGMTR